MRRTQVFARDAYPLHSDRRRVDLPVPPHAHDFCEVAVIVSGHATYRTRHGNRRVGRGDVVAVRPGSWHEYRAVADLDVLNVYLGPELLAADVAWILDHPRLTNLLFGTGDMRLRLSPAATDRTRCWLEQLALCRTHPEANQSLQLRSLLGCVFAEFAGAASGASPAGRTVTPATRTVLLAMAQDPARAWTATELAALAGVSSSHLQHQFAGQLGVSPFGWLAQYRSEQMAVRLAATDAPVAEIGRAVGWPDPNYATRRFRATYGIPPTEYRRKFAFATALPAG